MTISLIAATDQQRAIGYQNRLPWHLPADLKHFKNLTWGKPILMGRKTFESIGKPLPGRENIILTHQADYQAEGCRIIHSLTEAMNIAAQTNELMVIGGAVLFEIFLPLAKTMYLTRIEQTFAADSYFPAWSVREWRVINEENHLADEQNTYDYCFMTLERKSS